MRPDGGACTERPEVVSVVYTRGAAWNSAQRVEMERTKPRRKGVEPPGVSTAGVPAASAASSARRESSERSRRESSSGGEATGPSPPDHPGHRAPDWPCALGGSPGGGAAPPTAGTALPTAR